MAETRYAIVTGANKGIGFEICRQLASNGIMVVLTARDEKGVLKLLRNSKGFGLCDLLVFHQLDVANPSSIASFADFIKTQFGRVDILVNNAGILGAMVDWDAFKISRDTASENKANEAITQTYELTKECLETNFYEAKRMIEAFIPLLHLSNSPRIVNVSSERGKLKYISSEWARRVLNDAEGLREERIEEVLNAYLKDFKAGSIGTEGWPPLWPAYKVSKAALNSYTRTLAKKYPTFRINCVCPGFAKTDLTNNNGKLGAEKGAESVVMLALVPDNVPSGLFFDRKEVASFVE